MCYKMHEKRIHSFHKRHTIIHKNIPMAKECLKSALTLCFFALASLVLGDTPCPIYNCINDLLPFEPHICMLRINESMAYVKYQCRMNTLFTKFSIT